MKGKNLAAGGAALLGAAIAGAIVWQKTRPTIPEGYSGVDSFDAKKYLGLWYEVARLPMIFEKGLTKATAHYSLNDDETIKVINRGYKAKKREWEESEGKAKFAKSPDVGELEVSFFGPFYAGYNVIDIDKDYENVLIFGRNLKYMWLLSRETEMPEKIVKRYLKQAEEAGYDTSKLIWSQRD